MLRVCGMNPVIRILYLSGILDHPGIQYEPTNYGFKPSVKRFEGCQNASHPLAPSSRFGVNGIQPCGVIQPYPFLLNLKEVMMKFQFVQHHEPESACVGCGNPKGEFDDRNNPELADHHVKIP